MRGRIGVGGLLALATLAGVPRCDGQAMRTFSVSRPSATQRFLHVTLDFSGGSVILSPASAGTLFGMRVRYDPGRYMPVQQYDPRTGILHLGIEPVGGMGVLVTSRSPLEQIARFELAADVPLALYASLGASDATIDLGGTTLTELDIHAGATHAAVEFSRPLQGTCKSAHFTVAASQLDVNHLARAGCGSLQVDGGAGRTRLGFQGEWRRDIALVVDQALGSIQLLVPRGTGVRLSGERFLAPFDATGFSKSNGAWITPGFDQAAHKLTVELKASLLRVELEWIEPDK